MFNVSWNEDGSATVLARITARDGSGAATGVAGEGYWLEQADIDSITCKVFALDGATPTVAITEPSVDVATAVLDTPVTSTVLWTKDSVGYNFLHDLSASVFPEGDQRYQVEYTVTLTGGTSFTAVFVGIARSIRSS